jgi:hypothetical protein
MSGTSLASSRGDCSADHYGSAGFRSDSRVYVILLASSNDNLGLITGVVHAVNGAVTIAASAVLTTQIHRNLKVTDRSVTSS